MLGHIYKYFPSGMLDLVFKRNGFCGIKCSRPKDYNDPFELFLGVDLNVATEELAAYRELVQELPQFPTTCFSKSPVVAPMWAHYAQNHSGCVLEFDAKALSNSVGDALIKEVSYKEEPDERIKDHLRLAMGTKKPRHTHFLQQAVMHEAYFSKFSAWSYEEECRLVCEDEDVEDVAGSMILFVPQHCVTSIFVGKGASDEEIHTSCDISNELGVGWYQSVIGKSQPKPFFKDRKEDVFVFDGKQVTRADNACDVCSDPVSGVAALCAWCKITEDHENEAAQNNPFRIMDHFGLLEGYLEGLEEIARGKK